MNEQDNQILEGYLEQASKYMEHIGVSKRLEILNQMRAELLNATGGSGIGLDQAIKSQGSPRMFANRYLIQSGFPGAKEKNDWTALKIFFMISAILLVVGGISLALLIKSITPLWKVDEEKGTFEILGSKIILEKDDTVFFNTSRLKSLKFKDGISIDGDIEITNINRVVINADTVDFAFRTHDKETISYRCKSDKAGTDFMKIDTEDLVFDFIEPIQCLFKMPANMLFKGEFKTGHVNIRDLKNTFEIKLDTGYISWKQDPSVPYNVESKVGTGVQLNTRDHFKDDQAVWSATLSVRTGSISLR